VNASQVNASHESFSVRTISTVGARQMIHDDGSMMMVSDGDDSDYVSMAKESIHLQICIFLF
jgi:hypothetical protein